MSTAGSGTTPWRPSCTSFPRASGRHLPRRWPMSAEAIKPRKSVQTPSRVLPRDEAANPLIRANIWVAVLAFGVAAAMAMMQAISRANLELPYRSASMYYMSVTAHGVLMALVFTTFFIMGLGYAIVQKENGEIPWPRLSWVMFWLALAGVMM